MLRRTRRGTLLKTGCGWPDMRKNSVLYFCKAGRTLLGPTGGEQSWVHTGLCDATTFIAPLNDSRFHFHADGFADAGVAYPFKVS